MIAEGALVRFCGDGFGKDDAGLALDDQGQVVSATPTHSHVVWRTGALKDRITLTANLDLVVSGVESVPGTDDSLEGPIVSVAAKTVYERGGATAVLNALVDGGHTAAFASIAQEAYALVARRIQEDPSFRVVLAALDIEEAQGLVSLASVSLLRDAFEAA